VFVAFLRRTGGDNIPYTWAENTGLLLAEGQIKKLAFRFQRTQTSDIRGAVPYYEESRTLEL
jgi:hypothetical protein